MIARRFILLSVIVLAYFAATLPSSVDAEEARAGVESLAPVTPRPEILHHDLRISIAPNSHHLFATDRMSIRITTVPQGQIAFSLRPTLTVDSIQALYGSQPIPLTFTTESNASASSSEQSGQRTILVQIPDSIGEGQVMALEWRYRGVINDPPREPRRLRFVTPSETSGHIGPEGVYLSGETQWYPEIPGSLPTFHVQVTTPREWVAVTHGRELKPHNSGDPSDSTVTAEWEITAKTEALTVVANKFVTAQRDWRDRAGNNIQVATYLFPDDAHLADEYLDASIRYLEAYIGVLGPYPFPKFAVVENFFASGLGMPSFTLLGSGVIKRHYVQPYALGHEIVHSWIGNAVFNRVDKGNWVEGLTTFLANYYWLELTGTPEQARDQRRLMLFGYAVHVRPDADYPVGAFTHKTDEKDNAIGYQKSAMIFHMLRQEIGDADFWSGLKTFVKEYRESYADWNELEQVFSRASGHDLRWFFAQWVERAGAPVPMMGEVRARQLLRVRSEDQSFYELTIPIQQEGEGFQFPLELLVGLEDGSTHSERVRVTAKTQEVRLMVPKRPVFVELDPSFLLFRRLDRDQLPPMLNVYVTDRHRTVVPPELEDDSSRAPYQELVNRVVAQDAGRPTHERAAVHRADQHGVPKTEGSVLVLGGPGQNEAAKWAVEGCGEKVRVREHGFMVNGMAYEGPAMALLVSCRRPDRPGSVSTLFYGASQEAAAKVSRLLFFYGWQGYVIFRDGAVAARGDWEFPLNRKEVRLEHQ